MQVLVGDETEELVLDDGAAEGAAGDIAMQLRVLLVLGMESSFLKKNGAALIQLVPRCTYAWPWKSLVPEVVLRSMCAPLVAPCCASYIEAFTRTSWIVSGAGVGMALPIAR